MKHFCLRMTKCNAFIPEGDLELNGRLLHVCSTHPHVYVGLLLSLCYPTTEDKKLNPLPLEREAKLVVVGRYLDGCL